jgi:hypothetical protein
VKDGVRPKSEIVSGLAFQAHGRSKRGCIFSWSTRRTDCRLRFVGGRAGFAGFALTRAHRALVRVGSDGTRVHGVVVHRTKETRRCRLANAVWFRVVAASLARRDTTAATFLVLGLGMVMGDKNEPSD